MTTISYAVNQGVRIHYQVEGEGPPLVLLHGLTGSLEQWRDNGYVLGLKDDYQLILISARGHGASDKPYQPEAYHLKLMAEDVVTVMDHLNLTKAHCLGYSMGARIGFFLAKHAADRFHSFILGGAHPYELQEVEAQYIDMLLDFLGDGIEAFVRATEMILPLTPDMRAHLLANDAQAVIAAERGSRVADGLEDVPPTMAMPCLIFAGEADPFYHGAKRCGSHMPNATFVSLPGLTHPGAGMRSDLVLPHVTKFLRQVGQA